MICVWSAARPSRNNPSSSPCSAEQLPFPWPSFYCCIAGQLEWWSCTSSQACQSDSGAIIQARRNRTIKCRCMLLLAQLLSSLMLFSCQINSQFSLSHNGDVGVESIKRDTQTICRDTNKSQISNSRMYTWIVIYLSHIILDSQEDE